MRSGAIILKNNLRETVSSTYSLSVAVYMILKNWNKKYIIFTGIVLVVITAIWIVNGRKLPILFDDCNIAGLTLRGDLMTYLPPESYAEGGQLSIDATASAELVRSIEEAGNNDSIKGILLEIDSYGGYPVAAEEVANSLKQSQKPTVALIRESGASAAYLVATGADWIIASRNSDIGGIGITASYVENVEKNKKEGLLFQQLSIGKYKDAFDPNKPLTQEEKNLILRDLNVIYENFIEVVSKNRNLPIEVVKKMADGSTMLGLMALENKLIDEIGGEKEVLTHIESIIHEKPVVCWPQPES